MRTVISQSVVLPAPAESLFAMYTDPAKHAATTGAPVAISVEPGSPFRIEKPKGVPTRNDFASSAARNQRSRLDRACTRLTAVGMSAWAQRAGRL